MESSRQRRIGVLLFPWLAHGHISPFLELAKKLTNQNFHIYFCSTPVNLNSIKPKLTTKHLLSIQLVELHLPSLPELPPHYHTTKGLPPHLMPTLKVACDMASPSFSNILKALKPDLLIYDFVQPWASVLASSMNIPAVNFLTVSAAMNCFIVYAVKNPNEDFPFPAIYFHDCMKRMFANLLESSSNKVKDIDRALQSIEWSSDIVLLKTFRELESNYIDYLSLLVNKKIVPVGPLVEDPVNEDEKTDEVIEWLDKRKLASTIFVSFGTEYFLSKEEREEIAHGLDLSRVNFIWVVRFPAGEKIKLEDALPEGYLGRIQERGLVVLDWAPQAKILAHSSIGGFVSHCGWSSVMESMKFGVPMIGMPMNLDQPINARLVEDVGVGIEVRRNKNGGLEREEIAKVIREVVVERNGNNVRKKTRDISVEMRKKGEEEIDGVVDELARLHHNKIQNSNYQLVYE